MYGGVTQQEVYREVPGRPAVVGLGQLPTWDPVAALLPPLVLGILLALALAGARLSSRVPTLAAARCPLE